MVKVGDTLPSVELFEGAPDKKVKFEGDLIKGKLLVVGVPGAFTPTCHKDHLPSILSNYDALKSKGVDNVVCLAVNDPFVMAAWGNEIDPNKKIRFLADTCGEMAKALGVDFDVTAVLGNVRSKRFALVAENGVVKAINVEPDGAGLSCTAGKDVLSLL